MLGIDPAPGRDERSTVNETYLTVSGVVASEPRAMVLDNSVRITTFRLASTPRRRDRAGQWVDGDTTWLNVTCWRTLAVNAAASVRKRDRVVVHGRLRVRPYTTTEGVERLAVEVEADAVGHDMAFGTSVFSRVRRVEPVERAGRAEADQMVQEAELAAMAEAIGDSEDEQECDPEESIEDTAHALLSSRG
jgi:single-strand DNA-binding protein